MVKVSWVSQSRSQGRAKFVGVAIRNRIFPIEYQGFYQRRNLREVSARNRRIRGKGVMGIWGRVQKC